MAFPMHACSFEPRFDDHLVGAFHTPRADRPPGCLKGRVLHLRFALREIRQIVGELFHVGMSGYERP